MPEPDALRDLDASRWVWWCLGVIAYLAWVISADLSGGGTLTLIGAPLLAGLWLFIVVILDRWVRRGAER
jgi:hypothetical protein